LNGHTGSAGEIISSARDEIDGYNDYLELVDALIGDDDGDGLPYLFGRDDEVVELQEVFYWLDAMDGGYVDVLNIGENGAPRIGDRIRLPRTHDHQQGIVWRATDVAVAGKMVAVLARDTIGGDSGLNTGCGTAGRVFMYKAPNFRYPAFSVDVGANWCLNVEFTPNGRKLIVSCRGYGNYGLNDLWSYNYWDEYDLITDDDGSYDGPRANRNSGQIPDAEHNDVFPMRWAYGDQRGNWPGMGKIIVLDAEIQTPQPWQEFSETHLDFEEFDFERSDELCLGGKDRLVDALYLPDNARSSFKYDIEPRSIAYSEDGGKAYVTLTLNNGIAVIDLLTEKPYIEGILCLGSKDFLDPANAFDAVKDNKLFLENWPILGLYQPDGVAVVSDEDGNSNILTANTGDFWIRALKPLGTMPTDMDFFRYHTYSEYQQGNPGMVGLSKDPPSVTTIGLIDPNSGPYRPLWGAVENNGYTRNGESNPSKKWPFHRVYEPGEAPPHLPEFVDDDTVGDDSAIDQLLGPASTWIGEDPQDGGDPLEMAAAQRFTYDPVDLEVFSDLAQWGGHHNVIFMPGGRSFSVWKMGQEGHFYQAYDSHNDFEAFSMQSFPRTFNSKGTPESTSSRRGPTPRGITTGEVLGVKMAFITLQNSHAVFVYDISDLSEPRFSTCLNTADAASTQKYVENSQMDLLGGDVGPTDVVFVKAEDSCTGNAQLIVSYRGGTTPGSGNVVVWEFRRAKPEPMPQAQPQ